jgi:hypothetical protein
MITPQRNLRKQKITRGGWSNQTLTLPIASGSMPRDGGLSFYGATIAQHTYRTLIKPKYGTPSEEFNMSRCDALKR